MLRSLTLLAGLCLTLAASRPAQAQAQSAVTAPTQYVQLGADKVAYRVIGQGRPIVLTNRFRGTLDTWDPLFLDKLAEGGYQVITYDYPGVGYSGGTMPTDIHAVARTVRDLAAALKLDRLTVLGWSYGGYVAQVATFDYPQLVQQTVLIGTAPPGMPAVPPSATFKTLGVKPVNDLSDEQQMFYDPKVPASMQAAVASHQRISQRLEASRIPATPALLDRYQQGQKQFLTDQENLRSRLLTLTSPLLLLEGSNDASLPIDNWYALLHQLPTAQVLVLPQAGHAVEFQYPELTTTYIHDFLRLTRP